MTISADTHTNRLDQARGVGTDAGLLAARSMLGVVGIFHGTQKLFGWFGGGGIEGTAAAFEHLGIPLPTLSVYAAGAAETFGGLALIVGLATRFSALTFGFTMLVAAFSAHWGAFDARNGGMEYPLTLAVFALALVGLGAGRWSLDRPAWAAIAERFRNPGGESRATLAAA